MAKVKNVIEKIGPTLDNKTKSHKWTMPAPTVSFRRNTRLPVLIETAEPATIAPDCPGTEKKINLN